MVAHTQDLQTRSGSSKQLVYRMLRTDIVQGVFDMGERLNEGQLALRYGMGKTPVREALGALLQEGLVEVVPRVGYRTSRLSLQDIEDALELRKIVEAASAEKAALNITDEALERLEKISSPIRADDRDSILRIARENAEFHCIVAELSGNKQLAKVVANLVEQIQRLIVLRINFGDAGQELNCHHDLLGALRRRDPEGARNAMLADINNTEQIVLQSLQKLKANWHV